jgi:N-acetyl-anhydromuramyl-L-alanine amidase AmpD
MKIVNGWLDEAIEIDYSHKSMSRSGYRPTHVVLHGTAGGTSAVGIGNYFRDSDVTASAHIIIDQSGNIVQGVSMDSAAWGNGVLTAGHASWLSDSINPNLFTISIEHCKAATDNSNVLTDIQRQKSFEVVKCICDAYGIPKRAGDGNGGIVSHATIDPINRARCPGPYDWQGLYNYLSGQPTEEPSMEITLATPGVSQFFEGTSMAWKCKQTGYTIDHGGLDFYRRFGNSGLCGLTHMGLPTSAPIGIPGKPGVIFQRFERAVLTYDPGHIYDGPPSSGAFYLAHIDQGITQDPRVPTLTVQNAQLKDQVAVLQKQLDEKQVIPQAVKEDILILGGNIDKLKQDTGLTI